jgi:hypothetical protein
VVRVTLEEGAQCRSLSPEEDPVTTFAHYMPENRVLDLSELSQPDFDLLAGLRGHVGRGDRVLICLMPGGNDGEMYIRKDGKGIYRAVHFPGGPTDLTRSCWSRSSIAARKNTGPVASQILAIVAAPRWVSRPSRRGRSGQAAAEKCF